MSALPSIYFAAFLRMASALGVRKDENSCSSFEHILRQEAKFDADFLFSLDFFNGKMVRNCR